MRFLIFISVILFGFNVAKGNILGENDTDCKRVLNLPSKDSVFMNPVYFCSEDKENLHYYSRLQTTVCEDTVCQLLDIKVYWDLAGNYIRFDTVPGTPLTKYDHKPFTDRDYQRLQKTLADENSVLGEKTKDELLSTKEKRYSEKIDGLTAATAKEIKSVVVDGALYSTYTLWHLIHGNIKQNIRKYTLAHYNSTIEKQLLRSDNPRTILLGLKNMNKADYVNRFDQILKLMKSGNPFVNFYIAKNLPKAVFQSEENRKSIKKVWNRLDQNTKSILLGYSNMENEINE